MTRIHVAAPPRNALAASNASALAPNETNSQTSSTGTLTPDSQHSQLVKMADAYSMLTQGCLHQITESALGPEEQPVVQCVQIKPMNNQNGAERYRVVMSDSINFMQGMLGQRV